MACSSSHGGPASESPRILIVGPGQTVTAIADELRGLLVADAALANPEVATLASENDGGVRASDTLMSCFYVDAGREARLARLSEEWSFIVLLEAEDYDLFAPEFFFAGARAFSAAVPDAKAVVLMRWDSGSVDETVAHAEVSYRVADGIGAVVAPAGYASARAQADVAVVAAATLYSTITGRSAAGPAAAIAHETVTDEAARSHYTGAYHGAVAIADAPAGGTMWLMASGSSSEQLWLDRMNDALPRAGYTAQGTHIGFTNAEKIFDSAALTSAQPYFDAQQYAILLARTYSVDAATIRATGAQADLQVQIWDRHADGLANNGVEALDMMEARLNDTYAQAKYYGATLLPYHLMFAKLKLAQPAIGLTSDGTHATAPVAYGLAVMSVVARTGVSPDSTGLDANSKLAAQIAEETVRELATLSASR